jgi:hypothetical protein
LSKSQHVVAGQALLGIVCIMFIGGLMGCIRNTTIAGPAAGMGRLRRQSSKGQLPCRTAGRTMLPQRAFNRILP